MTLVYQRTSEGSGVHAFVVGVGSYPYAKPERSAYGADTPKALTDVPDLASAPVGARLFADWLIANADNLALPLASVELALSAPSAAPAGACDYEWKARLGVKTGVDPRSSAAVSATDGTSVQQAGIAWAQRVLARDDQVAVFYICGHGTAIPTRSLVLLSDVAGPAPLPRSPWQPFVDVQHLAGVMSRMPQLGAGYLFIDACQELITDVVAGELDSSVGAGASLYFFTPRLTPSSNKVLLMVPGSMGQLAYDDGKGGGGRFTQVLVDALSGAAARNYTGMGQWGVHAENLPKSMKALYRLRGWPRDTFDPTTIKSLVTDTPIVRCPQPPLVPFAVRLQPLEAINVADEICLQDAARQPILVRKDRAEEWIDRVPARVGLCYVQATFGKGCRFVTAAPTQLDLSEMRVEPAIVHQVSP
ncbi:MAG: caspase family protein [Rhodopila sp.]